MQRTTAVLGTALALTLPVACKDDVPTATVQPDDRPAVVSTVKFNQGNPERDDHNRMISIRDACDPDDPGWAPTGGCLLREGYITLAEFNSFLTSPLTIAPNAHLIGHPAWRNEPSYLTIESGKSVRIQNLGGRTHTFTEVADYGGGRVPPLNIGLNVAPACATAQNILPGEGAELYLHDGLHKFQCCIHPWMRAAVRVGE